MPPASYKVVPAIVTQNYRSVYNSLVMCMFAARDAQTKLPPHRVSHGDHVVLRVHHLELISLLQQA